MTMSQSNPLSMFSASIESTVVHPLSDKVKAEDEEIRLVDT